MKKEKIVGYTTGVYDLFHIGHLKLLQNAKGMCDRLIVGVTTDEAAQYKNKVPIIPYNERAEIVRNIKCVDSVVPQKDMDKVKMCKKLHVNYLFVGDDWYETDKWKNYEKDLSKVGVKVVYFPYTENVSSTKIIEKIKGIKKEKR